MDIPLPNEFILRISALGIGIYMDTGQERFDPPTSLISLNF